MLEAILGIARESATFKVCTSRVPTNASSPLVESLLQISHVLAVKGFQTLPQDKATVGGVPLFSTSG